jgi:hypothetical protein
VALRSERRRKKNVSSCASAPPTITVVVFSRTHFTENHFTSSPSLHQTAASHVRGGLPLVAETIVTEPPRSTTQIRQVRNAARPSLRTVCDEMSERLPWKSCADLCRAAGMASLLDRPDARVVRVAAGSVRGGRSAYEERLLRSAAGRTWQPACGRRPGLARS